MFVGIWSVQYFVIKWTCFLFQSVVQRVSGYNEIGVADESQTQPNTLWQQSAKNVLCMENICFLYLFFKL